jgi:N-dimethylarginine dimethylaminohydrolase
MSKRYRNAHAPDAQWHAALEQSIKTRSISVKQCQSTAKHTHLAHSGVRVAPVALSSITIIFTGARALQSTHTPGAQWRARQACSSIKHNTPIHRCQSSCSIKHNAPIHRCQSTAKDMHLAHSGVRVGPVALSSISLSFTGAKALQRTCTWRTVACASGLLLYQA